MICKTALAAALCFAASGASALDLPGAARLAKEVVIDAAAYPVPIAPFADETVPVLALDGAVRKQAWQLPGQSLTPFQVLAPLVEQLKGDGYSDAFSCEGDRCGGFDFRFGIDVLPAPDMFVNLRDFLFTTLLRGPEGQPDGAVLLLASAAQGVTYLQVVEVSQADGFALNVVSSNPAPTTPPAQISDARPAEPGSIDDLLVRGAFILEDLAFDTGATTLGTGPFQTLDDLSNFLLSNPDQRVALVGHTDSVGSLDGNIRISKQRAQAVRKRLVEEYGIPEQQLDAEGMGYLAPRASNLTPEGRETNRRVEVIVLSDR